MENALNLNALNDATTNDIAGGTPSCTTNCTTNVKKEIKWGELADSFLMVAFAVGVYSQIFSFFLYAFTY